MNCMNVLNLLNMPSGFWCIVAAGGMMLAVTSCSVEKMVQKRVEALSAEVERQPDLDQLPVRKVSWNDAVAFALKNNLEIKQGQLSIDDAERRVRRVYMDMIPGVNLDALMTKDIGNLGSVSSDDIGFHTNILFNLPSLTQIPITYYTAKASVFRANKSMEMKKRELISKLYKNVRSLEIARARYELSKQESDIKERSDGTVSNVDHEWREKSRTLAMELISLMGDTHYRWQIDEKTVPKVSWDRYKAASGKLDHLVLAMMAMELEASRLNVLGIKMRYFPELNVNFYSPSLFTNTGGTYGGFFADSGDMYVNMNLSLQLDTKLSVWDNLQSAKASHAILEKEVFMRALERKDKVKKLMKSREDFEAWASYIKKRAAFLDATQPLSVEEYKNNQQEVSKMYRDLYSNREKNLQTEAALIMEYGFLTY